MVSLAPQILAALEAASSPVQETRQQGEAQLQQLKSNPSAYFSSCAEIFVSQQANLKGRQLVGFQLKNNLANPACAQNTHLQTAVCEHAIVDPQRIIRNVAGSIISVAVREGLWPAQAVVQRLGTIVTQRSTELEPVHGAIRTLSYIVDDAGQLLDAAGLTKPVFVAVVPFLTTTAFGTTAPDAVEVRVKALEIVSLILELAGVDFDSNTYKSLQGGSVRSVIQACFENLQAPISQGVATLCIRCIVLSLTFFKEIDDTLFTQIGQLMYQATTAGNGAAPTNAEEEALRIEATEFWRAILHFPHFAEVAQTTVVQIIPVLIRAMIYSDMEMGMLEASAEDWQVPDKADAIRPRHYSEHRNNNNGANYGGEDGNDAYDDEGDDDEVEEWNLRRASALTLDDLSEYYGDAILETVLSCIAGMMRSPDWRQQEAAVLALGAFCEGCFDSLTRYLPDICPMLLQLLEANDTHFLVVSITLWTSTRLGAFFLATPNLMERLMACILRKMENPSKMVQGGAVEALMDMLSKAEEGQMDVAAPAIVQSVATCFGAYQLKNRVLLFEAVQTICQTLGGALRSNDALVSTLMNPLSQFWSQTPNDSPLLWGLFDCMASVCSAVGPAMQPMAGDIFSRSFALLREHLQMRTAALQAGDVPPDEEFIITSAILLSGLFDAMGSGLEPLVAQNEPLFVQMLLTMLSDAVPGIRQNGFSLVSDVARTCPTHLQQVLPQFCEAAVRNASEVDESSYGVVSNVAWSVCNLLEHQVDGTGLPTMQSSPAMPQLFALFANLLGSTNVTADMRNMAENIALCLGVMLYVDNDIEAKSRCGVQLFAAPFCRFVRNIRESSSLLEAATCGFLMAVQQNPSVVLSNVSLFCDLACSVAVEGVETSRMTRDLLSGAARANQSMWRQALSASTVQTRNKLYQLYGLQ
jgi:transportin-2